jgi:hypothetical protein
MTGKALPFMPWYPGRFLSSTRGWPLTARAIYRELLDAQWELNALPAEPSELRQMIGATPTEWKCWRQFVERKFPIGSDGMRRNPTLEEHRAKSSAVRERNRIGANKTNAKRWGSTVVPFPGSNEGQS